MTSLALLHDIAEHLDIDGGLFATVEHPGYIAIPHAADDGTVWAFGTVNKKWDGQLMTADGSEVLRVIDVHVPVTETNPGRIALAIARALLEN